MRLNNYNVENISKIIIANGVNRYAKLLPEQEKQGQALYKSDMLNNPVMSDLEILGGSYKDLDGNKYEIRNIKLDTVLMTITQTKNIVTTTIAGRNGTIKEYIAMGDYLVDIAITVNAPNGAYPTDIMAKLIQIKKAPVSLKVASWYLQQYSISNLVITEFTMPQEAGKYSSQTVNISAISDSPYIPEK